MYTLKLFLSLFIFIICLSSQAFSSEFQYIAIPHFSENTVEFRRVQTTANAGTLNFWNESPGIFNCPFNLYGPNAVAIWQNYLFVSFDNFSTGGVLIYNFSDLFTSGGSFFRNSNPPIIIQTNAGTCGLLVDSISGDLYVSTAENGGVSGKITKYTRASLWSGSTVLPIPQSGTPTPFVSFFSGLTFDGLGNIWAGNLYQHSLICYKKLSNYEEFYYINGQASPNYTASRLRLAGSATISVYLLSDPEGLAKDPDGGIWFANNNDIAFGGGINSNGTFGKINSAYISNLMTQAISGSRVNPSVSNYYEVPQANVALYYVPGSMFGGIAYNNSQSPSTPYGLFINDEANGVIWNWRAMSDFIPFDSAGLRITAPGFGGISFNTSSFNISGGKHIKVSSGITQSNIASLTSLSNKIFAAVPGAGVFKTSDFGINWTASSSGISNNNLSCIISSGVNLFAGSQTGIFTSADNGLNWTSANNGLTSADVTSITSSGASIYAGTSSGGVFFSGNNGSSWTPVNNGLLSLNIKTLYSQSNILIAGTSSGGIFRSTNNGSSWSSINSNLPNLNIRSVLQSGSIIYAGTASGLYVSANNGSSWSSSTNGLPAGIAVLSLAVQGNDVFAGTSAGLFLSTNNGQSWMDKNQGYTSVAAVNSILISNGYLFTGTDNSVWRRSFDESVPVLNNSVSIVKGYGLSQNYPNPFNPTTKIKFQLPDGYSGNVKLTVYNSLGMEVQTLTDKNFHAGVYEVTFNAASLASGIYFYKLAAGNYSEVKKMCLVK